jgi:hypothetical protein
MGSVLVVRADVWVLLVGREWMEWCLVGVLGVWGGRKGVLAGVEREVEVDFGRGSRRGQNGRGWRLLRWVEG